jgi:hypothetical protein
MSGLQSWFGDVESALVTAESLGRPAGSRRSTDSAVATTEIHVRAGIDPSFVFVMEAAHISQR